MSHIPNRPEHGCWVFRGAITESGYGRLWVNKKRWLAHRLAWTVANGPIPDALWVLHRCDVPTCVRPDHLFLGDHVANMVDMVSKGRAARGDRHGTHLHPETLTFGVRNGAYTHPEKRVRTRGEQSGSAKLTADDVRKIRERYWAGRTSARRYARGLETQRKLAECYGISQAEAFRIIHSARWGHI